MKYFCLILLIPLTFLTLSGLNVEDPRYPSPVRDEVANVSCRVDIAPGSTATVGFVIDTTDAVPLLVRAVGPGLQAFGVAKPLADPALTILQGQTRLVRNDNWREATLSFAPAASRVLDLNDFTAKAAQRTGAFALADRSLDAATVVFAEPGAFTVQVADRTGSGGEVLIEVYRFHDVYPDGLTRTWQGVPRIGLLTE
ncbi:hypothetical protein [Synoicihabitans lomoniglobus]|uniref:Uncharacterized protein n=1 Tax=Synoicihabitans lomoniglobus TaxID=2909285 RepID=A0AAF0CQK9_9BACT|nr:hypothetical protein [Opitutaceae bacterium LMO-M01]WED66218.1 hypothetical protein PXH66_05075 [Opitutaceae bacterium LMO-M01]